MVFLRDGFDETYVNSCMSIAGIFGDHNMDADEFSAPLTGPLYLDKRRKIAEKVTRDGKDFYRYNIISTINHGLARQDKPLPAGIPIQLSFARADAKKSLLQVADKDEDGNVFEYKNKTVPILDPILSCYFVESKKADELYAKAKLYDVNVNFMDYGLRRELLMNDIAEHNLKIFEGIIFDKIFIIIIFIGPLPSAIIFGLIEPDVFNGDFGKSALKFQRHGLDYFELKVDSQPVVNHPLKMKGGNAVEFFCNYLKNTNRFYNMFSNGSVAYEDFVKSNFLLYTNLKQDGYTHGQLTLKLQFEKTLPNKLFCVFIPIFEKQIVFDAYLNPQVQS